MSRIAVITMLFFFSTACRPQDAISEVHASPGPALPVKHTGAESWKIERGLYIVSTAGCHDCHTPITMGPNGPAPDMTRMLSGHPAGLSLPLPPPPSGPWIVAVAATNTAWSGPWGVSFTANLTPDRDSGLGTWTEQNFIDTIRNGRHMGAGRALLPPMPVAYAKLTTEDLSAVFAYLKTIPAISNKVPAPLPPHAPSGSAPGKP